MLFFYFFVHGVAARVIPDAEWIARIPLSEYIAGVAIICLLVALVGRHLGTVVMILVIVAVIAAAVALRNGWFA